MILATTMIAGLMTGCGQKQGETAKDEAAKTSAATEAKTEPFGDTIIYDPSVEINNGEKIDVEFWIWGSENLFQELVDGYTAIHPNVNIELVVNPWDDYWTKLPLVLQGQKKIVRDTKPTNSIDKDILPYIPAKKTGYGALHG